MSKYQGHKNWNHWNVSLWLSNDEETYRLMQRMAHYSTTRAVAVQRVLGQLPTHTPDGAPYSAASVRAAMVGI